MKTSVGPVILVTTDLYILFVFLCQYFLCVSFFIFRDKFTLERQLGET